MHRHRQTRRFGVVPFFMVLCNPPNADRRLGVLGDVGVPALLRSSSNSGNSSNSRNTRSVGGVRRQQMFETAVNKLTFLERGLGVSANRHAFSVYFGSTGVLSFRKYEHQNSFDRRFEDQQRKYQFGGLLVCLRITCWRVGVR